MTKDESLKGQVNHLLKLRAGGNTLDGTGEDPPALAWRPLIFTPAEAEQREALDLLLSSPEVLHVHDTLAAQLQELAVTDNPADRLDRPGQQPPLERAVEGLLAGVAAERYGRWVYFPWSRRLVRLLSPDHFARLRSDRNRLKILTTEQQILSEKTIGVLGLSVGSASAVTMAMEGVGGHFRLADKDTLSLSNLNRLRVDLHDIGVKKTVLAARSMYQVNPFLDIRCFHRGVSRSTAGEFLGTEKDLDLLVEECDDMPLKLSIRYQARARGIPVIMETSDRGMLDVENFKNEPARLPFHGLLGACTPETLETMDPVEVGKSMIGGLDASTKLLASLVAKEEGKLSTWPQLASAVTLGGAVITDTARRILLEELHCSGRYYVDLEQLIRAPEPVDGDQNDTPAPAKGGSAVGGAELLGELQAAGLDRAVPPRPGPDLRILEQIVRAGNKAPSAGNSQPWRFLYHGGRLLCLTPRDRQWTVLDFQGGATLAAHGAVAENMSIAAAARGHATKVRPLPLEHPRLSCVLTFDASSEALPDAALEPLIRARQTNRRRVHDGLRGPGPMDAADLEAMASACAERQGAVRFLQQRPQLDRIGQLIGAGDRITLLDRTLAGELMAEIRWSSQDVQQTRDGIDVRSLELGPAERFGLQAFVFKKPLAWLLKTAGLGYKLEELSVDWIASASSVGLITVDEVGPGAYFQGGRAMQRLWLAATQRGVYVHPMTALPYLLARMEQGGEQLSDSVKRDLSRVETGFRELFPRAAGTTEVLLFRLGRADPPTCGSLRRGVEGILEVLP